MPRKTSHPASTAPASRDSLAYASSFAARCARFLAVDRTSGFRVPARVHRTATSFIVVLVAYVIYRVCVAPWVDPSFELDASSGASAADIERIREADQQRRAKYARYFPAGSWELDQPIMLESEGVELLMKDYENLSDGRIRLSQCTMLYVSNESHDGGSPGRVVILRAPEGAILKFDSDLNLRRGKIGRLIGGELKGPITIHGSPSSVGADDELFITTRDLLMEQQRITSNHLVEFRYGPNFGQGRDLTIELGASANSAAKRGPTNLSAIESFSLARDVRMTLQPGSAELFPGGQSHVETVSPPSDSEIDEALGERLPVEVRCQGPFHFDVAARTASFHDHVHVHRMWPQGVSDQMTSDQLRIYFGVTAGKNAAVPVAERKDLLPAGGAVATKSSLQPQRFEATGNPVIVDAPSNNAYVRANRLDYEILRRRIAVEAFPQQQEAIITWKQNEFRGRSLVVERSTPSGLPLAAAVGEGRCQIAMPDDSTKLLHASWTRELKMGPVEQSHLVSLLGAAHTDFPEVGNLDADEIHLWLVKVAERKPPEKLDSGQPAATFQSFVANERPKRPPYSVTPERMLALRNVRFGSAQLTGVTEHLDVRFDPAGTMLPTPPQANSRSRSFGGDFLRPGGSGTAQAPRDRRHETAGGGRDSMDAQPLARSVGERSTGIMDNGSVDTTIPPERQQHFELHGTLIRAQLRSQGDQTLLDNVTIEENVRFRETRTRQPTDRPLEIRGDWLQILDAATAEKTTVVANGKPAHIAASGLEIDGDEIHLDRGRNELWIPGRGRTVLPASADGAGATSANGSPAQSRLAGFDAFASSPVSIDFQGGMKFDGKVARYNNEVQIRSEERPVQTNDAIAAESRVRTVTTEAVEVTLRRPVNFVADRPDEQTEVEKIACLGGVVMKQVTSDRHGKIVAEETLLTRDLSIHQSSGEIHALGPGTLESTRLSTGGSRSSWGIAPRPTNSSSKQSGLEYSLIKFDQKITGNLDQRRLVLHENVHGVYGPIERWGDKLELNQPRRIGPDGICFRSDQLTVTQVDAAPPQKDTVVLEAIGNTEVEGEDFRTLAGRLVYRQDQGQLELHGQGPGPGEGRNDAELYYQPQVGAAQTTARAGTIFFWPATGAFKVQDAQFTNVGQFSPAVLSDKSAANRP
jgi:hypothetical protein